MCQISTDFPDISGFSQNIYRCQKHIMIWNIRRLKNDIRRYVMNQWSEKSLNELLFQCLGQEHHRTDCQGPKCQYSMWLHDSMLQNCFNTFRNSVNYHEDAHNLKPGKNFSVSATLYRCHLLIVKATVVNEGNRIFIFLNERTPYFLDTQSTDIFWR